MGKTIPAAILVLFLLTIPSSIYFSEDYHTLKRAVDGDTLLLSSGQRVRLIGVDTREVHYSKKLQRYTQRSKRDLDTISALGRK